MNTRDALKVIRAIEGGLKAYISCYSPDKTGAFLDFIHDAGLQIEFDASKVVDRSAPEIAEPK